MGNYLNCRLFGTPEVSLDGEIVLFSFSKINAMLYYLLINKTVSRDELSGLLWPDKSDKNAKKNLRNAIYQANKSLGMELIISPNKSLLMLNDTINFTSDVAQFTQDPETYYYLYKGEFLKGFYLKECEGFDFWVVRMKRFFEKKFVETVHRRIEQDIANGVNEHVEEAIEQLMFIDEFNEINYQYLMTFYQQQSRDNKVVDVYHKLSNLLKSELGVTPNKQKSFMKRHLRGFCQKIRLTINVFHHYFMVVQKSYNNYQSILRLLKVVSLINLWWFVVKQVLEKVR